MKLTAKIGKNKVKLLLEEAYALRIKNIPQSVLLVEAALKIARAINNQSILGKCLNQLALYSMIIGDYKRSLSLSEEAIKYFTVLNDKRGIADAKYNIAGFYYKTDNFHMGLVLLLECQTIYLKFKDYHNLARVQKSLGTIYEYFGDLNNAYFTYENSVRNAILIGDLNLESNAYNPLSGILLKQNKLQKAEELILKSVAIKTSTGDLRGLAFSIYGRAKVHLFKNEYQEAENDLKKSISIHKKMNEQLGQVMALNKLGRMYFNIGRLADAKKILKRGLKIAKTYNILIFKFKCSFILYQIYKLEKNNTECLKYLEKYLFFKEKVADSQVLKVIENYEMISKMRILEEKTKFQKERSDELINTSNKRYELSSKASKDVLWDWDIIENKMHRSAHYGQLFGYKDEAENIETDFWFQNIHLKDRRRVIDKVTEHLADKNCEYWEDEYRYYRKNREISHIVDRGYIVRNQNNNAVRMVGAMSDISQQQNLVLEKEKMMSDMVQRNRDLEQFAYIISHNLRAPVANIMGLTALFNDETNSHLDTKVLVDKLSISVKSMDNVIADLNTILQVKNVVSEMRKPVIFSELLANICLSIDSMIAKLKVKIISDFSEIDEMLTLKSYLYSIFYNLISNSIKYRQPHIDPVIEIKSYKFGNTIGILFKDNGRGIDLQKNGHQLFGLYKRFHQVSEGKGIGLYMTKTQVETLGGKIRVTSEVDVGTEFNIEFEG